MMTVSIRLCHILTTLAVAVAATGTANQKEQRKPVVGNLLQKYLQEQGEEQRKLKPQKYPQEREEEQRKLKPRDEFELHDGEIRITFMTDGSGLPDCVKASGKIETNTESLNFGSMTTTKDKLDAIMNCPQLTHVNLDQVLTIDLHERHGDESMTNKLRGRKLAEDIPFGTRMVQADEFVNLGPPSQKVKVCVIDTGYDNDHYDLPKLDTGSNGDGFRPSRYTGEWFVDGQGHGTHVAGTIGAIGGNGNGVNSVLSYADDKHDERFTFWIGKGLSDSGSGWGSEILDCVNRCALKAAAEGVRAVVNLSLGGGGFDTSENNAYQTLFDSGNVLLVAAAGNDGNADDHYPSSYTSMMAVAAVASNENLAYFSSYHGQVEIAGPGLSVESTVPGGGTAVFSGTSMASPHVAGVAALVWGYFPTCSNREIRNVLLRTAKAKGSSCNHQYGYGIVQAKAAYDLLLSEGCSAGDSVQPSYGGCGQYCPSGSFLKIEMTVDNYPGETGQKLMGPNGVEFYNIPNPSYTSPSYLGPEYEYYYCLNDPGTYTYNITDSYGDGICCGWGQGDYKILVGQGDNAGNVNWETAREGGEFGSQQVTTFEILSTGTPSPTKSPTRSPTASPTSSPTKAPTKSPTASPTDSPTKAPTAPPTAAPIPPTQSPTASPTRPPTPTTSPTASPTKSPTSSPTNSPTASPTASPTKAPTTSPTKAPTAPPTVSPTKAPTTSPTRAPTASPTTPPTPEPTQPPTLPPDEPPLRFVTNSVDRFELQECEADCDEDDHCDYGLICYQRRSSNTNPVPGCSGVPQNSYDYCIKAPEGTLVHVGNNDLPFKLGNCQGDCDQDSDCEDGLECYFRSDGRSVPGCDGVGIDGWDYCYIP